MNWQVELYETETGRCPVEDFIPPARDKFNSKRDIELKKDFWLILGC